MIVRRWMKFDDYRMPYLVFFSAQQNKKIGKTPRFCVLQLFPPGKVALVYTKKKKKKKKQKKKKKKKKNKK